MARLSTDELVRRMDLVREICSAAAKLRAGKKIRNRQPLSKLDVYHPDMTDDFAVWAEPIIKEEVNVKSVVFHRTERK